MELATQQVHLPPYSLWESRAGSGTPVVLLHGLAGSSRWWSRNIEVLAEEHLVAAVDLVGFGRSRRFTGIPLTLPSFAEVTTLLGRWIETFAEPVHVIGHSMGGQIAIRLAAERPELIRSLILVNSAGMPFHIDPMAHLRPLPRRPFGGPRIAQVLVPDILRAGPTSVAVASARVLLGDMRKWMHAVRAPTLLVWGENDPLIPLRYGEAMHKEIAGSRLLVIPDAAHVAMYDAPEAFNRAALEFLREVERRPARQATEGMFAWGLSGWTDGVAHRQAGAPPDVVLVHGLGMSSAYYKPLARSLFARGLHSIAPDIPGFGESADAPPMTPEEQALELAKWADAGGLRRAIWAGHSIGCNTVQHLAFLRPDLVRGAVFIGPLWTPRRFAHPRLVANLLLDTYREPLTLFPYVMRAYWRAGLGRWFRTWRRFANDLACSPQLPEGSLVLAGRRDPIPDRACVTLREIEGAHACQFSHPDAVADEIVEWMKLR